VAPKTSASPEKPVSPAAALAALFNVATVDDSDALQALERHKRLNDIFIAAIKTGDKYTFDRALDAGADVNYAAGAPLQQAAAARNYIFLRELMTRGASAEGAIAQLENAQSGIYRKPRLDEWGDRTGRFSYKNKEDEHRWSEISAQVKVLKDYQKVFISDVMPLETLRLQHETLQELRALRREVTEAIHGKPMQKPKLKGPGNI